MELLSNVRFPDNCSDIWGYADSAGQEYAFVGRVTGTSVFDVTNPKNPVSLQFIPGAISSWREIKTYKNRAYVVADKGQDGIIIINMSQAPSKITWSIWHPTITVNDVTLGISKTVPLDRAHDLFIDEKGICYLHGGNVHPGLVMLDLNKNPDIPEYIGIFNPAYSHGGFARRDTFWSADIFAGEFSVWDIKDKSNPKKLAGQRTGNAFTHSIALSDDSQYAFITDERENAFLESYKVDPLNNITLLDHYRSRPSLIRNTIPHNIEYINKFIVNAYYTDGFTVVDVSDPNHLVEVGAYDTYPAGDGGFHGCWGAYPYLPSGNIIASDIEFGLFIVKPTYVHASYIKGFIKDTITGLSLADASIRLEKVPFNTILSTNNGSFKTGGPYSGDINITVS
ncbi:MAG: choice-of-anchor B family protein, partial [Saprospiraceae bacterium]